MHGKKSSCKQYSKEVKTTRRRVEDAMKEHREEYMLGRGLQRENWRKRSKKLGRGEEVRKENPKTKWKMQRRGN
jgi:hypothetical protein